MWAYDYWSGLWWQTAVRLKPPRGRRVCRWASLRWFLTVCAEILWLCKPLLQQLSGLISARCLGRWLLKLINPFRSPTKWRTLGYRGVFSETGAIYLSLYGGLVTPAVVYYLATSYVACVTLLMRRHSFHHPSPSIYRRLKHSTRGSLANLAPEHGWENPSGTVTKLTVQHAVTVDSQPSIIVDCGACLTVSIDWLVYVSCGLRVTRIQRQLNTSDQHLAVA